MPPIENLDKKGDQLNQAEQSKWDQSVRAGTVLQHILESDMAPATVSADGGEKRVTVEEAIASRAVLDQDTGRNRARVLFVTTDSRALVKDSGLRQYYSGLAAQLDEVHVMCLRATKGDDTLDRAGENLWFYEVKGQNWWNLPWAARNAAIEALTWNGTPRPDVVVGVDMFEAGLGAYLIAKRFRRPLQYHISIDPFAASFKTAAPDNNWRQRMAKFLLKRAKSARFVTGSLKDSITARFKRLKDVAVLPKLYGFNGLSDAVPTLNLHQKFPDFSFVILAFGNLTADSELHDVFSALHRLLKTPRIGLVVVGDGPGKQLFLDKVKILGIEKNVAFVKEPEDLASYLKTADLMIELDTDEEAEIRVLKGAMAGTPLLVTATDLRRDLFKDGESAFICEPGDLLEVSQKTSKFINSAIYRAKFAENGSYVAKTRINEDPTTHYQAIALTIEAVLATATK